MIQDQILCGLLSQQLRHRIIQVGNNFTLKKALDVAKKEEQTGKVMQLGVLQVDTVSQH